MKQLKQITVIGLGLLGGSVTKGILHYFKGVKAVGYAHRAVTRAKAKKCKAASEVTADLPGSVRNADIVILCTPIFTFESFFEKIAAALPSGCIVTDVGSTKVLPHRWAAKCLGKAVYYVGSHPIAGSEHRGIEFAEHDLFKNTDCIVTTTKTTNNKSVVQMKKFWARLGCNVKKMSPAEHDRIYSKVSHLPHITAASLINVNNADDLKFAGSGLLDTSRIASGPVNIWSDILLANGKNCLRQIDELIVELKKFKDAISVNDRRRVEKLLYAARDKRAAIIKHKKSREAES